MTSGSGASMDTGSTDVERSAKRQRTVNVDEQEIIHEDTVAKGSLDAVETLPNPAQHSTIEDEQILKEQKAGIIAFVRPDLPGFAGILKQRYSDFLVNEILPNGQVLHLENLSVPKHRLIGEDDAAENEISSAGLVDASAPNETLRRSNGAEANNPIQGEDPVREGDAHVSEEDQTTLSGLFGNEAVEELQNLYKKVLTHPKRKPKDFKPIITGIMSDREVRTQAHQAVRRVFKSRLESKTERDETMLITAAAPVNKSRGGAYGIPAPQRRGKLDWTELGGEYLHFSLYKENKDTMEVVSFLASQMKVNAKQFQFGGTKDRRAVTVQRVSAYRMRAEQMAAVGKRLRGSSIGDYQYQPAGLELGDLGGNEFIITLRDCHFPKEEHLSASEIIDHAQKILSTSVEEFKAKGFLNYFGLQRFGSFSTGTDVVGTKLLQGDLKGAVDDILSFSPEVLQHAKNFESTAKVSSDDKARAEAIDIWYKSGDAKMALEKLPRKFSAESNIIRHLGSRDRSAANATKANDFKGALQTIPRNLRLMYVHAYQSLVWNIVAGKRWQLHGRQVVAGDLVIVQEHKDKEADHPKLQEVDDEGEVILRPAEDDRAADSEDYTQARALTKEEAEGGLYSIFDVVLPLPGYDVVYPPNVVGNEYKTFMASKLGGGLDPLNMRRSWKDLSLSGGYRKLLGRPGLDMSFELRTYSERDAQLVETDLERLQGGATVAQNGQETKLAYPSASRLAVILKMKLAPSQYATMALRELMKSGLKAYKPDFSGGR